MEEKQEEKAEEMIAEEKTQRQHGKWLAGWADFLHRTRFVFAVPWTIVGVGLLLFNVDVNITLNRLWAEGNVFLVLNTLYGAHQLFMSIITMFEVERLLKYAKFIRICDLFSAFVYNAAWLYGFGVFMDVLYNSSDYGSNLESLTLAMFLGYNLVVTGFVVPINVVIAIKELSMEWIQFNNPLLVDEDISLGMHNLWDMFRDVIDLFNPWCWFNPYAVCFFYE